jgi:glycerol-3-phosphate acyltransferase PlsY
LEERRLTITVAMTIWALAGYLAGSLSGARIVAAATRMTPSVEGMTVVVDGTGTAVQVEGVSASTLYARGGAKPGLAAGAIDIAKAFVPTYLAVVLGDEPALAALVASAVLLGHVFPVFHRFKGGFGISPLLGTLLAIDPLSAVAAIVLFGFLGVVAGNAFLGIESWPLGLIGWFAVLGSDWELVFVVFANLLFWSRSWREAVTAFRSWRTDERPWRVRVGDFRTYPDYEAPQ